MDAQHHKRATQSLFVSCTIARISVVSRDKNRSKRPLPSTVLCSISPTRPRTPSGQTFCNVAKNNGLDLTQLEMNNTETVLPSGIFPQNPLKNMAGLRFTSCLNLGVPPLLLRASLLMLQTSRCWLALQASYVSYETPKCVWPLLPFDFNCLPRNDAPRTMNAASNA